MKNKDQRTKIAGVLTGKIKFVRSVVTRDMIAVVERNITYVSSDPESRAQKCEQDTEWVKMTEREMVLLGGLNYIAISNVLATVVNKDEGGYLTGRFRLSRTLFTSGYKLEVESWDCILTQASKYWVAASSDHVAESFRHIWGNK